MLAQALPGLDSRRSRHRRDLLLHLAVSSLAGRAYSEAAGEAGLAPLDEYVEDLLEAAIGLMLAPVGPDNHDPRRPVSP